MREDPGATGVRDDWRERSKMLRPQLNEVNATDAWVSPSGTSTPPC